MLFNSTNFLNLVGVNTYLPDQAQRVLVNNPLEQFEIIDYIFVLAPIFGFIKLSLTNIGVYSILVFFIVLSMNFLASNHYSLIPSRWSISQESFYGSIINLVRSAIGPLHEVYVPLIYTLFMFILVGNLVGLIPYSYTVTSQFCLAIGLSFCIMLSVTYIGFQRHGIGFFALFVPSGTPLFLVPLLVVIELISYAARSVSLGLRLSGNLIAGHITLSIIAMFGWKALAGGIVSAFLVTGLSVVFLIVLGALEMGVALIQAYVFVILTCSYLRDGIYLHGPSAPHPKSKPNYCLIVMFYN